jgi:hypothetical protein
MRPLARLRHSLRLAGWLGAVLVVAACAAVPGTVPGPRACVLIDTDAAIDDLRAVAVLVAGTRVVGVVATEGVTLPPRGAMALRHLLAAAGSPARVVVGAQSASPSAESWLPPTRANAERLNGFLGEAVPVPEAAGDLGDEVARMTGGCAEVRVAVLGPWSSFVRYQGRLGGRLKQVVTQGLPIEDVPAGRAPGFNCRYDLAACRRVHDTLRAAGLGVWVDVPRGVTPPYAPTVAMVDALGPAGLPGTLRALLGGNPEGWRESLLTDDVAALYMLHPAAFGPKGRHLEPTVSPEELRGLWVRAVNRVP